MAKKTKLDHPEAIDEIRRLLAADPETDEAAAELWMDSEGVVDYYLGATEDGSANLPTRQELGQACFWMARMVKMLGVPKHMELVVELLSPSVGLAMYEIRPRVAALKEDCIVSLQKMAAELDPKAQHLIPEEDIPF